MAISRRELFPALAGATLLTRADAEVTSDMVRFRPEMEPLVALIERTAREKCAEMAVEQLRRGVSYRQFMAALFLAGVRNVNPRPPGFAMHCVFVIHAAHLLGMEAPADARMYPLFFALDTFKASQERDAGQAAGNYTMRALSGALPAPDRAGAELTAGMESWDQERAERAAAALARHRGGDEVFRILWHYGARDYRNIGHKAIYTANASRTLQTIGWQHAEPVLRSVVLGLLDFGREQKVNGYALEDQCYAGNVKRVKESFAKLPDSWVTGPADGEAARGILAAIRDGSPEEACADLAARLRKGQASAASAWDGVHLASAELRMRAQAPAALASIHGMNSANALHHAFLVAPDARTQFFLLLQGAGWMTQFRVASGARPESLRAMRITEPEKFDAPAARVFGMDAAARQAYLSESARHTAGKANEVHYYKFLAAQLEDVPLMSPEWQPHLAAATTYYAKTAADSVPAAMQRARTALGLT